MHSRTPIVSWNLSREMFRPSEYFTTDNNHNHKCIRDRIMYLTCTCTRTELACVCCPLMQQETTKSQGAKLQVRPAGPAGPAGLLFPPHILSILFPLAPPPRGLFVVSRCSMQAGRQGGVDPVLMVAYSCRSLNRRRGCSCLATAWCESKRRLEKGAEW